MTAPVSIGPLRNSFAVDEIEQELKQLFIDLFEAHVAPTLNDENVLGMAHLGSSSLIERMMGADGLVLPNRGNANAYAYLYRAWKGRNSGRGLHFLKTCLQLIWPNAWDVEQMMQVTAEDYPTALYPKSIFGGDADKFLTSRIRVSVDATQESSAELGKLAPILRAVIPARLVPHFAVISTGTTTLTVAGIFSGTTLLQVQSTLVPLSGSGTATLKAAGVFSGTNLLLSTSTLT